MTEQNTSYGSAEARKIVADYIDQSALRLTKRLKKAYLEQEKQVVKVRSYV